MFKKMIIFAVVFSVMILFVFVALGRPVSFTRIGYVVTEVKINKGVRNFSLFETEVFTRGLFIDKVIMADPWKLSCGFDPSLYNSESRWTIEVINHEGEISEVYVPKIKKSDSYGELGIIKLPLKITEGKCRIKIKFNSSVIYDVIAERGKKRHKYYFPRLEAIKSA